MASSRRRGPFPDREPADAAPSPPRRYSDEEARTILQRATDESPGRALTPAGDGHSLVELEEAAREAGIDPMSVRVAALSTLPPPATSLGGRLVGGAARRRHRLFVPGRLPPERRPEVTAALERVLEREMVMEDGGGYVAWEEDHRQGWTRVTVREVEGGLEVGLDADRRGWVTLAGVGSVAVVGALVPFLGPALVTGLGVPVLLVAVLAVALVVGGMRLVWAPAAARLQARLQRAVAEVIARVDTGAALPAPEPGRGASDHAGKDPGRDPDAPGDAAG